MSTRTETDSMGPIEVPADRYWGAQTAALAAPLRHRRATACRAAVIRALGDPQEGRRAGQPASSGKLAAEKARR